MERTAVHKEVTSFGTFLSTLCHEFCHHLDFKKFGFTDSAAKASWWSNTCSVSSAHALANSGRFFLIVAIRLDSRCMRSSLFIVLKE